MGALLVLPTARSGLEAWRCAASSSLRFYFLAETSLFQAVQQQEHSGCWLGFLLDKRGVPQTFFCPRCLHCFVCARSGAAVPVIWGGSNTAFYWLCEIPQLQSQLWCLKSQSFLQTSVSITDGFVCHFSLQQGNISRVSLDLPANTVINSATDVLLFCRFYLDFVFLLCMQILKFSLFTPKLFILTSVLLSFCKMLGGAVLMKGVLKTLWDCRSNDLPKVILNSVCVYFANDGLRYW